MLTIRSSVLQGARSEATHSSARDAEGEAAADRSTEDRCGKRRERHDSTRRRSTLRRR